MKFKTNNPVETRELAKKLVQIFVQSEKNRKNALVVSLEGELGTGKTTFTQGLAKALGVESWIKSPTFILMREHIIQNKKLKNNNLSRLYHVDCYRLTKPEALIEIGLKDILKDPQNIVLIEWGEKIAKFLPQNTIRIKFKHLSHDQREIKIL
ncbi:tRNA (adenosine(37)-N6)-threonylcarbamoyltransferase complex ATPase subunit type 1 TsaE [bacterium]|nr:MAG: tRNA (adenosine(37)-N6)-threonylcarbamoyltransferase complex ATPase subunit type 1 TsaE [bacterium]